jgi:hypothetical protein
MRQLMGILAAAGLALPAAAVAGELGMTMFGHKVEVVKQDDELALTVDGSRLLANAYLMIEEMAVVGNVPVAIGSSSNGGNACPGDRFVLSFSPGAVPRLDGQPDDCVGLEVENKGDHLLFFSQPIPGRAGVQWSWTAPDGFKPLADVAFTPNAATGWDALRDHKAAHPAELFSNAAVAKEIYALLGADKEQYERSITGVGSGSFDGDVFTGMACTPHMCTEEEAILVADIDSRTVYLAWKPFNKKIIVRPPVKQWPDKARAALKDWAAKWKG